MSPPVVSRNRDSRRRAALIAIGALGLCSQTALANTLQWIDPAANGVTQEIEKSVTSMKALRTRGIFIQRTDYSCGAAALATVLHQQFGMSVDEGQVIRGMLKFANAEVVQQSGFSLLDMRRYVDSLGLRGSGFRIGPERLFDLKVPVITLIDTKGYRHFVIVKHAAEGRVHVADPSYGHRVFRIEDFVEMWTGVILAVTGRETRTESILMERRGAAVLAHRSNAVRTQTQHAAIDFGFKSIDLF